MKPASQPAGGGGVYRGGTGPAVVTAHTLRTASATLTCCCCRVEVKLHGFLHSHAGAAHRKPAHEVAGTERSKPQVQGGAERKEPHTRKHTKSRTHTERSLPDNANAQTDAESQHRLQKQWGCWDYMALGRAGPGGTGPVRDTTWNAVLLHNPAGVLAAVGLMHFVACCCWSAAICRAGKVGVFVRACVGSRVNYNPVLITGLTHSSGLKLYSARVINSCSLDSSLYDVYWLPAASCCVSNLDDQLNKERVSSIVLLLCCCFCSTLWASNACCFTKQILPNII